MAGDAERAPFALVMSSAPVGATKRTPAPAAHRESNCRISAAWAAIGLAFAAHSLPFGARLGRFRHAVVLLSKGGMLRGLGFVGDSGGFRHHT
jgi:hypothetical protein